MSIKNSPVKNIKKGFVVTIATAIATVIAAAICAKLDIDGETRAAIIAGVAGLIIAGLDAIKHRRG